MGILSFIYHEILYNPIFKILTLFYNISGRNIGFAIIILTILIKILLFPLTRKTYRIQKKMAVLQPKMKEIQLKHKGNKEEQARQTMALYKEHGVNPFSGFIPLLIQLPILIALYQVLLKGLAKDSAVFNPLFFGINLANPNLWLGILVGITQYFATKLTFSSKSVENKMPASMNYIMPAFMAFIAIKLASGIALYLLATTVLSVVEQLIIKYERKN